MLPVLVQWAWAFWATLGRFGRSFTVIPPLHCAWIKYCLFWCDGRERFGRPLNVLPTSYTAPRLHAASFGAMVADIRATLYCAAPPWTAVRVSAARFWSRLLLFVRALPVYPTVRLGAALALRIWWIVPFLQLLFRTLLTSFVLKWPPLLSCCEHWHYPPFMLLVGVGADIAPTDAGSRRCSYLALYWHPHFATTCSGDTARIYRPSALFHASTPSPVPPPTALPTYNVFTSDDALGQAAVIHAPQPECPRDRKGTHKITLEPTLEIPRLETGRTSGRRLRRQN